MLIINYKGICSTITFKIITGHWKVTCNIYSLDYQDLDVLLISSKGMYQALEGISTHFQMSIIYALST